MRSNADMIELDPGPYDLAERSRSAVQQVLSRFGWQLLERDDYVQQVTECLATGEVQSPWPAAIHVYCRCLYRVCCGDEGLDRQTIAFTELHRYLYALSFREVRDLAADVREEVVNEALLRIWQRLPSYRRPGAFLAIAAYELRNALRPWWGRPTEVVPIEAAEAVPNTSAEGDPVAQALTEDLRRQVAACFDQIWQHYPKARRQLEAVWLKYIGGFDDKTISAYLDTSVANTHVLRNHGLKRLRATPCWQRLVAMLHDDDDEALSAR